MDRLPKFDDLPLRQGDPPFSAWGLYGENDELGFQNRVTEKTILTASKEIKTGARVSLNWALQAQPTPGFKRQSFHHLLKDKHPRTIHDDIWTFNTQSSSQWDGLRHFGYQHEKLFYNGVTASDIQAGGTKSGSDIETTSNSSSVNGIQNWAKKGIVGRGVLLDFAAWRDERMRCSKDVDGRLAALDSFTTCSITLQDLQAVMSHQNLTIEPGDILIIRSGYIRDYEQRLRTAPENIAAHVAASPPTCIGVERSEAMLRWIWENFCAVAGDQPAFESYPAALGEPMLHEVLLAGWGCPIGELFDLERLSEECKRQGRYSFMLVSEPTNVTGGVASPPNALAIF